MQLLLDIQINSAEKKINYIDKIALVGSCFTEAIGNRLKELKFSVLQNPNGILYDPLSISRNLISYVENKEYKNEDLFYLNELWQSWQHHSSFSEMNAEEVLQQINQSQNTAHEFLKDAGWLIITLGSAYNYELVQTGEAVANCHKAPASDFNKKLLSIDEITTSLSNAVEQLRSFNSKLNFIFTVSPVRHIKDGVVENNLSKARLIEATHALIEKFENIFYFPAYEIVIDVLRDYRFYEADLVHPNTIATDFVFDKFSTAFINLPDITIMEEIKKLVAAKKHKVFHSATEAYSKFRKAQFQKANALNILYPYIDLSEEIKYFE